MRTNRTILPLFLAGIALMLSACISPNRALVRIASGPPMDWLHPQSNEKIQKSDSGHYVVQSGDTLWAIAVVHSVDPEALVKWNSLDNPDQLYIGQSIILRPPRTASIAEKAAEQEEKLAPITTRRSTGYRNQTAPPTEQASAESGVSTPTAATPSAPTVVSKPSAKALVRPSVSTGTLSSPTGSTPPGAGQAKIAQQSAALPEVIRLPGKRMLTPESAALPSGITPYPTASPMMKPGINRGEGRDPSKGHSIKGRDSSKGWQKSTKPKGTTKSASLSGKKSRFPKAPANKNLGSAPKKWRWPVRGKVIRRFNTRKNAKHEGIDIAAKSGTRIRAAADGIVSYADNGLPAYGNMIILRHGGNFMSMYAHANKILVEQGDMVKRGDVIGHVGKSGRVRSPRLHFQMRKKLRPVNPKRYLK